MHNFSKLIISIMLILILAVGSVLFVYADDVEGVSELEEANENISEQIEEQQSEIQNLMEDSVQLEGEIAAIDAELDTVAKTVQECSEKSARLTDSIARLENEIAEINEKITETEQEIAYRYYLMSERIAYFYENGNTTVLEALFSKDDFAKMLSRIANFQALIKYDRDQTEKLNNIVKENNKQKEKLEKEEAQLEEDRAELISVQEETVFMQAYYEELVTQKATQLQDTNEQIELKQASVTDLQSQIEANKNQMSVLVAEYDEMIRQMEELRRAEEESRRQAEEESRRAEEESRRQEEEESRRREAEEKGEEYVPDEEETTEGETIDYGTDDEFDYSSVQFIWPVPECYSTITSYFGYRGDDEDLSLFGGVTDMHQGIDIYAPVGTEIYSVLDGIVVVSDYSSAIGWYVAVYHGNGIFTEVHHMCQKSPLAVGTPVAQGDVIGYVGATGYYCTGPHLHFGVCIGDGEWLQVMNYVDPAQFLGL